MINLYWIASIWRQNDLKCWVTSQTIQTAKLQKWSTYTELHRFDVKTSKNDELRRKPFRTAKLQKWSTYTELHRFDVKTSKNVQLLAKHSKPLNSQSYQLILNCIDLTSKGSKMLSSRKPFKTAKLQKWYNYDELHAFDIKTNKNIALGRKPFKTTQNYKIIKIQ